jgi:hypothetical protein
MFVTTQDAGDGSIRARAGPLADSGRPGHEVLMLKTLPMAGFFLPDADVTFCLPL